MPIYVSFVCQLKQWKEESRERTNTLFTHLRSHTPIHGHAYAASRIQWIKCNAMKQEESIETYKNVTEGRETNSQHIKHTWIISEPFCICMCVFVCCTTLHTKPTSIFYGKLTSLFNFIVVCTSSRYIIIFKCFVFECQRVCLSKLYVNIWEKLLTTRT